MTCKIELQSLNNRSTRRLSHGEDFWAPGVVVDHDDVLPLVQVTKVSFDDRPGTRWKLGWHERLVVLNLCHGTPFAEEHPRCALSVDASSLYRVPCPSFAPVHSLMSLMDKLQNTVTQGDQAY